MILRSSSDPNVDSEFRALLSDLSYYRRLVKSSCYAHALGSEGLIPDLSLRPRGSATEWPATERLDETPRQFVTIPALAADAKQ
jgi:hypothetical protein